MWLVVLGTVLLALKLSGYGFVAAWPWWLVLLPFALAAVWWRIADSVGITQRAAMRREEARAAKRREAQYESLGMRAPKAGDRTRTTPLEADDARPSRHDR